MIDLRLGYEAAIFADARNITPDPDTITRLISIFRAEEFIPGTFQELGPPNLVSRPRLSLSRSSGGWQINIASSRIAIVKNPIDPRGSNLGELGKFCSDAVDFSGRIMEEFRKRANRLALISNFMLKEMRPETLSAVYLKLFNPPPFYAVSQPFEWNWRSVSRRSVELEELQEELNVITAINRVQAEFGSSAGIKSVDRIQISLDVNTVMENAEHRFERKHIVSFYDQVLEIHNSLLEEMVGFIDGKATRDNNR